MRRRQLEPRLRGRLFSVQGGLRLAHRSLLLTCDLPRPREGVGAPAGSAACPWGGAAGRAGVALGTAFQPHGLHPLPCRCTVGSRLSLQHVLLPSGRLPSGWCLRKATTPPRGAQGTRPPIRVGHSRPDPPPRCVGHSGDTGRDTDRRPLHPVSTPSLTGAGNLDQAAKTRCPAAPSKILWPMTPSICVPQANGTGSVGSGGRSQAFAVPVRARPGAGGGG